jgi:pimeloyl-ACP methyl ester carboxylesterase
MHMYCTGAGSPTIVIEAGLGNDWLDAQEIQPSLSRLTRVCTYDRSGLGWSPPRSGPRDAATIARQLHTLLDTAGVPRPLVLMGHSGGGIYVRVFASAYPSEVTGLVLVDAASPQQFSDLPGYQSSFSDFLSSAPQKSRWKKLRILSGLQRLAGKCHGRPPQNMPSLAPQYNAQMCRLDYEGGATAEYADFTKSTSQAANAKVLSKTTLLILSADPDRRTKSMSSADIQRTSVWNTEQENLKPLSLKSFRVIAHASGHNIYHDKPNAAISEISRLILYLRGGPAPPFGTTHQD